MATCKKPLYNDAFMRQLTLWLAWELLYTRNYYTSAICITKLKTRQFLAKN